MLLDGAPVPDSAVLAVAVAVAYVPGLVLLTALAVPPGLLTVALAPATSVAVAGVVAVLVAPVGLPFGPVALLGGDGSSRRRRRRAPASTPLAYRNAGLAYKDAVAYVGPGARRRGDGRRRRRGRLVGLALGHRPARHAAAGTRHDHARPADRVRHAHGARSAVELAPVDLVTGAPTWFYPSGVHLLASATAGLTGGAVVPALNAQTVVLLAAAGCTGPPPSGRSPAGSSAWAGAARCSSPGSRRS